MTSEAWPELHYEDWKDTCATLHMWTQIAGKIRMAKTPPINHWWHVPLYVGARGLGTSPIPDGDRMFEIDFDLLDHILKIHCSDGTSRTLALEPVSVATFYRRVLALLRELRIEVSIRPIPSEVADPIPFDQDEVHHSYDREAVDRFRRVLVSSCRVLTQFRAHYLGKVSPVHFFWGSFDLAVTRFSGHRAPLHPGAPGLPLDVTREAYSHEVSSIGWWPGGNGVDAAYYAYAYPEPAGFGEVPVKPAAAFYSNDMREFFLPYEAVRSAESPEQALLDFAQSTYEAAANLAGWPRSELER